MKEVDKLSEGSVVTGGDSHFKKLVELRKILIDRLVCREIEAPSKSEKQDPSNIFSQSKINKVES
ncbi:MAG: hypothetical protein JNN15_02320 [Blastocatellia bacterium]|nr:hypothetical protein [Blastocatellia bacterium]